MFNTIQHYLKIVLKDIEIDIFIEKLLNQKKSEYIFFDAYLNLA